MSYKVDKKIHQTRWVDLLVLFGNPGGHLGSDLEPFSGGMIEEYLEPPYF